LKFSKILLNFSRADSKFSAISVAMISGGGRFSVSPRLSSLSQKMSKLALPRCVSSEYLKDLKRSFGLRSWRFCEL
jgi:hypothetical protein